MEANIEALEKLKVNGEQVFVDCVRIKRKNPPIEIGDIPKFINIKGQPVSEPPPKKQKLVVEEFVSKEAKEEAASNKVEEVFDEMGEESDEMGEESDKMGRRRRW